MDLNNLINKIGIKQQEKENKALDTYIGNSNQNKEKLETLLSEFKKIISDEAAYELCRYSGTDKCYNYISKKINNFNFDINDVNLLTNNLSLYNDIKDTYDYIKNRKFGLSLSALINKTASNGEKVQIITSIPAPSPASSA